MMVFDGVYTRQVKTPISFATYRDNNGAWIHIISNPDIDIRVELSDEVARDLGKQLINIGHAIDYSIITT